MIKIVDEILKKYGIKAIIFVIVFAAIIWGLVHCKAAPGKEIIVLDMVVK